VEKRTKHFGQENPHDQLAAQIGAIEGTMLNLAEGIGDPKKTAKNVRTILRAMRKVP
jgi:hypothetical protein